MTVVNVALIITISISIYSLVMFDNKIDRKRTKQILNIDKEVVKEKRLLQVIQKIPFAKTQKQLDQIGNPFKLNPISYLILKLLIVIIVFISVKNRTNNLTLAFISIPIGFFFIDFLHYRSNKNDLDLIRLDFADIDNILILKKKTGVVIGKALADLYKTSKKSKRLREALLIMAAKINFTGRVDDALQEFKNKFNFIETSDFVKCIQSSLETGLIEEELEGHARSINRDKKLYIKQKIRGIDTIIMIFGMLVMFGIVGLVVVTLLPQLNAGTNSMFGN